MKRLNIALIGVGRIGQVHLKNLTQLITGASVTVVADPYCTSLNVPHKIKVVDDAEEAINDFNVDAVVICTPTNTHASLIELSIRNGKHIFCEKPLDLSLDVTRSLTQKAAAAAVKLMVGFNRRFDHEFSQAKKQVQEGRIGNPQIIKITNRDPALPSIDYIKTSGGMFMDFTIHDFDMACYFMQKEVVEVFAKGLVFFDEEIGKAGDLDTALTTLTFSDGTFAVIDNSRKAVYGYDQRIEVFGDGGMIKVANNLYNQNIVFNSTGIHRALPLNNFMERYAASYLLEMQSFVDAVLNDTEVPVGGEAAIRAGRIALAANKSMKEKRPVKINEISS